MEREFLCGSLRLCVNYSSGMVGMLEPLHGMELRTPFSGHPFVAPFVALFKTSCFFLHFCYSNFIVRHVAAQL